MGNSMSAIIAVVAMSTLLLMPATSSAGAGGVSRGWAAGSAAPPSTAGAVAGLPGTVGLSVGAAVRSVPHEVGDSQPGVRAQSPTPHLMESLPNAKCIACSSLMNMVGAYVTWSCAPRAPGLDTAGAASRNGRRNGTLVRSFAEFPQYW